ncbi:MAG TPA: class I SAM-dependent methyltransferase [Chloroflexota bacterium]|nr:class I SAM-dependent methyltransferase [Chloroflexota bacterium]
MPEPPAHSIDESIEGAEDLVALDFLRTDPGQELLAGLAPADLRGPHLLRTVERLRKNCGAAAVALAIDLVAGRAAVRRKFGPNAPRWYTPTALQQASSAATAAHRAARLAPLGAVLEFCAGLGGDTLALARAGASVTAYEANPLLAAMLGRNLAEAGLDQDVHIHAAPAQSASLDGFAALYSDPSRRSEHRRGTSLDDLTPSIDFLRNAINRVPAAALKLSPATPLPALRDAFPTAEIEFVSVAGELREAVIWAGQASSFALRATILSADPAAAPLAQLTGEPCPYLPVEPAGPYIAEPDPALVRSGLFSAFADSTGIAHARLAQQIAFLTSATVPDTPFARYYRVVDALPFSERAIADRLCRGDCGEITVRCRGFPEPGHVVAARLQAKLGGDIPHRLFIYRSGDRHHAVISAFDPMTGE